ncbi:phosphoglycerate mutase-like protein 1 [Mangifera indica]|uniref:phosphoglycerate mutase-like protein 1 n=1 Tax=Mangifera indica TaxID=29780 RepID=UPI001CFADDE8|nr:phosphoglycerate mutase-like protein 1 [Mangifera indica]
MDVLPALLRVTSSMANPLCDMDPTTAHSTQGCKILHLVRHAQGVHNTVVGKGPEALLSQELFDAQLSDLGFKQVEKLRTEVEERELTKKIDLVIASPMLRTLQTAVGVFGGGGSRANGFDVDGETAVNGDKFAKIDGPPIIAVEHCRERWGLEPCNRRRSIHEYQTLFPGIDFQLIESEDDILWKADVRESYEEVAARGIKFLKWLWTRQEKEIAIVSHGIFLQQTLQKLAKETNQSMENLCSRFGNCEIRTVAINIADGSIFYHPHDVRKEDTQRKEASN